MSQAVWHWRAVSHVEDVRPGSNQYTYKASACVRWHPLKTHWCGHGHVERVWRYLFSLICDNVRQPFPDPTAHLTCSLVVVTKHAFLIFYKSWAEEEVAHAMTLIFKGYFFCPLSFHSTRQKSKASLLLLWQEAVNETAPSLGALRGFQALKAADICRHGAAQWALAFKGWHFTFSPNGFCHAFSQFAEFRPFRSDFDTLLVCHGCN